MQRGRLAEPERDTARVEQYDIRLRGRSSKGKQMVRNFGSIWTVVGTNGPNVLIVSPPTMPTFCRTMMESGDPNFEVERPDTPREPEANAG